MKAPALVALVTLSLAGNLAHAGDQEAFGVDDHLDADVVRLHQFAIIHQQTFTDTPIVDDYKGGREWAFFQWRNARYLAAIDVMQEVRDKWPELFESHFYLGTMHIQRGYPKVAYEELSTAIEINNHHLEGHNNFGVAAENMGFHEESLEAYETAGELVLGPTTDRHMRHLYPIPFINAARLLHQHLNRTDDAVANLGVAINITTPAEDIGHHFYAIGMRAFLLGDVEAAREAFLMCFTDPESVFPVPDGVLRREDVEELRTRRFSNIYDRAFWGYQRSGPGSSLKATEVFRQQVEDIIRENNVKSVLDIGCGDWTWMPHVNLTGVDYLGVDIVPQLIKDNLQQSETFYKNESNAHLGRPSKIDFQVLDAVSTPPPPPARDLVVCREVIIHLPLRDILRFLSHINNSGARLLILDMDERVDKNDDSSVTQFALPGAGWRPVNLRLPPFNFDPPLKDNLDRGARLWALPLKNLDT